ncbi:hypothetical protein ACFXAZ_33530 [Streptomyces sp. NPDC059477]|uniref:hypothetical protein n=1 Tax=Streptomyces sp. NPDC059477 TaxID=3346847 RepID=UPI00369ABCE2
MAEIEFKEMFDIDLQEFPVTEAVRRHASTMGGSLCTGGGGGTTWFGPENRD